MGACVVIDCLSTSLVSIFFCWRIANSGYAKCMRALPGWGGEGVEREEESAVVRNEVGR